jgi:uncharacterized protein (DUF2236 family)
MAMFPPGSTIRRVDGESVLLLGGPRALLMQLAHPAIARAVDEHSDFEDDPFARLRRTLALTRAIVFGDDDEAARSVDAIRAVHAHVVGDGYRAEDHDLLLWVHATLVDTALTVHRVFLGRLPRREAEEYYEQSTAIAVALGLPRAAQPRDLAAFRAYVDGMVATVDVGDTARRLARAVLHPPAPVVTAPVFAAVRQVTIGLLPARLRVAYGLPWDPARGVALAAVALTSQALLPRLPRRPSTDRRPARGGRAPRPAPT